MKLAFNNNETTSTARTPCCCSWYRLRHVCCKYGILSVVVAVLLTMATILTFMSISSCQIVKLNVGFEPSNSTTSSSLTTTSSLSFGFWFYEKNSSKELTSEQEHPLADAAFISPVFEGCAWYTEEMEDLYIHRDRTWTVARVMATLAASASFLSLLLAWSFCITPCCKVQCLWPTLLLPLTMIAFIGEGSKFLIFDVGMCRNAIWTPAGVDSLPQSAQDCLLGESSYYGMAAAAIYLICTLLVCMRVPVERELDPNYGMHLVEDDPHDEEAHHSILSKDYPQSTQTDQDIQQEQLQKMKDETTMSHTTYEELIENEVDEPPISESRRQMVAKLQKQAVDNTKDTDVLEKFVSEIKQEFH